MADFTRDFEITHPAGSEDISQGDNRIRNLKFDFGERLEDMLYGFNADDGTGDEATFGVKKFVFKEQASITTPSADQITLAAKESGNSKAELFVKDEDGDEFQITTDGSLGGSDFTLLAGKDLLGSATSDINMDSKFTVAGASGNTLVGGTLTVTGQSTFNNHINLGAGDDLIGSSTSDINMNKFDVAGSTGNTVIGGTLTVTGQSTFNSHINLGANDDLLGSSSSDINMNSKFTVSGSSGNTVVSGTLDIVGVLDPTSFTTARGGFIDEDSMATNSASKVCSQQSIKAYVVAAVAAEAALRTFGTRTDKDSGGSVALAKDEVYKAGSDGFISAWLDSNAKLHGFTDSSNPPTTEVARSSTGNDPGSGPTPSILMPVKKDDYWKITASATVTIYWLPIGNGTSVKQ